MYSWRKAGNFVLIIMRRPCTLPCTGRDLIHYFLNRRHRVWYLINTKDIKCCNNNHKWKVWEGLVHTVTLFCQRNSWGSRHNILQVSVLLPSPYGKEFPVSRCLPPDRLVAVNQRSGRSICRWRCILCRCIPASRLAAAPDITTTATDCWQQSLPYILSHTSTRNPKIRWAILASHCLPLRNSSSHRIPDFTESWDFADRVSNGILSPETLLTSNAVQWSSWELDWDIVELQ